MDGKGKGGSEDEGDGEGQVDGKGDVDGKGKGKSEAKERARVGQPERISCRVWPAAWAPSSHSPCYSVWD